MKLHARLALLPICLIFAGCDGVGISGSYYVVTPDTSLHGSGLEAASDSFFGTRERTSGGDSSRNRSSSNSSQSTDSELELGFDAEALDLSNSQSLDVQHSTTRQIEAYLQRSFGPQTLVKVGALGQQGQSLYFLKDGYGLLSDPTTVQFKQHRIEPRIELVQTIARIPDLKLDMSAGFGYEFSYLKTSIQSALLDIETPQRLENAVVTIGLKLRTDGRANAAPLAIGVSVRKVANQPSQIGAQVGLDF